jgi:Pup-like protein
VAKRHQVKKRAAQERKPEAQVEPKSHDAEALKAATDDLLDEIDGLLEDQESRANKGQPERRKHTPAIGAH